VEEFAERHLMSFQKAPPSTISLKMTTIKKFEE
jgi:hypothetical protein